MPLKPLRVAEQAIPVARPANAVIADIPELIEEEVIETPWYEPENLKALGTSLTLHILILIGMACWYFVPKANPPKAFDTRLAGSDMGVEEGLSATGGLNTPIEMREAERSIDTAPDLSTAALKPLETEKLEPKLSNLLGANKTTGGSGMDNNNPGAGNGDGFGLARFGDGGESVRGVEVKVGDPQFTLLWDTEADLDLHVIEPGGKEIYWEDPKGKAGGELDVDNTKGFGPENIYWLHQDDSTGERIKGMGPPGEYKWFVVYWGGFGGIARPTKWKVRIKHDGKVTIVTGRFRALNERSKMHTLKLEPPTTLTEPPTSR